MPLLFKKPKVDEQKLDSVEPQEWDFPTGESDDVETPGSLDASITALCGAASNFDATLVLVDGDQFEIGNKERVAFTKYGKKAEVKEAELAEIFGERVAFRAIPSYVSETNIESVVSEGDIVLLCVDNHATRKLVSQHCERLSEALLISGGNDGVENGKTGTFANAMIYLREGGENRTNSLTTYHPEIAKPSDQVPGSNPDESCVVLAQKIPQLAFTNLAVASEMLNALLVWACGKLDYEEVYLDILKGEKSTTSRKVANNPR